MSPVWSAVVTGCPLPLCVLSACVPLAADVASRPRPHSPAGAGRQRSPDGRLFVNGDSLPWLLASAKNGAKPFSISVPDLSLLSLFLQEQPLTCRRHSLRGASAAAARSLPPTSYLPLEPAFVSGLTSRSSDYSKVQSSRRVYTYTLQLQDLYIPLLRDTFALCVNRKTQPLIKTGHHTAAPVLYHIALAAASYPSSS
jgi:hypothetical protein